jgi:hypothetical protein
LLFLADRRGVIAINLVAARAYKPWAGSTIRQKTGIKPAFIVSRAVRGRDEKKQALRLLFPDVLSSMT